jgi:two-component system, OmpR family, phosphate regulon sensor histidine kinase PhoR
MSKKLFVLLVVLMSLSLMGIIFVQGYWIKTAIENKEEQFSMNINQILKSVSENIQQREIREFVDVMIKNMDSLGSPNISEISNLFIIQTDGKTNEKFIYSHGILEEDYGISSAFFENKLDSITIKKLISRRESILISDKFDADGKLITPEKRITQIGELDEIRIALWETSYKDIAKRFPIAERIRPKEIELLLQRELADRAIDIDFEYGVYNNNLPTKVRSRNFRFTKSARYKTPLFIDNEGNRDYDLLVSFPKKKQFLISSIIGMLLLSVVFTLIIIIAYSSALYQLLRQKQISEIKSDFINNMTHEFKTPIATINLALDAIKNPKISQDAERMNTYLNMIKEENKRMHAQVENVLRISRLEKDQLDITKDKTNLHGLIEDAISHVSLLVESRGGYINKHLKAEKSIVLANNTHFTNVLVNILDNAIKYSPEAPQIAIYTENVKNNIVVKIQDQGAGMSKAVLKRIFEKFYRESTGNIHNVKGHGLGLAYVKSIVEDHQGEVYAESEKNKGSTFYIKLPLI